MNISLEWLGDFVSGPRDPQMIADALMRGGFPVESIQTVGNDTVLDVEVTSNRGDCLSHVGVAREVAALLARTFGDVQPAAREWGDFVNAVTSVSIADEDLCPHYTARLIRGVTIGPSPEWMRRRLEAVGLRSINNIVDVTNYVMFEMGQPLHAFDFDALRGGRIVVRPAQAGETLISIDGHERRLTPGMLVIADAQRPVALAGVMGGMDSEVSAKTVNVLLESARFDPLSIRKTARTLAMKSDSSYRFERGIDPLLPERASLRAAQLILETAGGELLQGVAVGGSTGYFPRKLSLRLPRVARLLGVKIPANEALDALERLQLKPNLGGDTIDVSIPSFRLDLNIETDLIEEVARVVGYDKVPVRDEISIRVTPPEPTRQAMETVRSTLVAAGYFEAVTFSFVSDALAGAFQASEAVSLLRADAAVRKADARLRPSILPGLLEAIRRNETVGTLGARLFEIGSAFWADASGQSQERRRLALAGGTNLQETRGAVEAVLTALNAQRAITIVPDTRAGFAADVCGRIEWNGQAIGHLGRIDKAIADRLALRETPCAAEIDLAPLLAHRQPVPQLKPLPRFPAIERDLSLVVPESTRYDDVANLIQRLRPEHLEDLRYVTTYRGKPLDKGTKSLTVTLVFRHPAGTLTSEQVEPTVQAIIDAAKTQLGATLRA